MKAQTATNRSQSARLLKCGVPAESADMFRWVNSYGQEFLETHYVPSPNVSITPAWSLSALLGLLPKELNDFPFTKWYEPFNEEWVVSDKETESVINGVVKLYFNNGSWIVDYDWDGFTGRLPQSDNPIEACVLAIELLTANGYKLNGIKKGGDNE